MYKRYVKQVEGSGSYVYLKEPDAERGVEVGWAHELAYTKGQRVQGLALQFDPTSEKFSYLEIPSLS